jgi:anaerobic magnesium-protoporphyrin IX monomethyl ester cyclase
MKIAYVVPPMVNPKGYASIGQNRQFQWLSDPFFAYPIIPAIAMTMLASKGHQVLWVDCIAEELSEVDFGRLIIQYAPDYIIYEASTPVIKRYWEIINGFKEHLPNIKHILCGDYVTALPEETKENCKVDHVVQGGKWQYDVFKLITGKDWEGAIPHINRELTRWWLYAYKNGNYKYIPATYIMSAQDCWYQKCSFCSWATYHKDYYIRTVDDVLNEIERLIEMGFKEVFDDSGTFPTGEWLREFCEKAIHRKFADYIDLGCNMRFGALEPDDFKLMSKAGFRMVLWGLESVNQRTLNLINKGYKVQSVMSNLILAKAAGLQSHITTMFGFPWETYEEAKRTYNMVRWMLKTGWAWSSQATIVIPYPITPLWKYCKENNLLTTEDWSEYDMTKPVMKILFPEKELFKFQRGVYNTAFHPQFIWQKLKAIRNFEDISYYFRTGKKIYDRFGNFYEVGKAHD